MRSFNGHTNQHETTKGEKYSVKQSNAINYETLNFDNQEDKVNYETNNFHIFEYDFENCIQAEEANHE